MPTLQNPTFEFFTQPAAAVARLTTENSEGIQGITWPNEVVEIAQRSSESLSALVLSVLGIPIESLEELKEITSSLDDLNQLKDINNKQPISDDLRGLRQAIYLALRSCSQCRILSHPSDYGAPNTFLFRSFLSEIIGVLMPEYFVQEQLKVATSRGRSAKMNFFSGLSPTSRRASLLVLYDISGFESIFTSQVTECPRASSCAGNITPIDCMSDSDVHVQTGPETSPPTSLDSRNQTPDENQANDSDSDDAYNSGRSSSSAGSTRNSVIRREMSAYLSMTYSVQTTGFNPDSDDIHVKQQDVAQPVVSESTSHAKNAYLLTEDQIGKPPSVAMICAGPMDELESIMLSALYQRTVWGIAEPLIGFSWDSTGMIITIVFGWVDQFVDEDGCLPEAHLVYPEGSSKSGIFDMTDPTSVLRLVEFMWNIREDFRRITLELESAAPHVLQSIKEHSLMQWRADTTSKSLNEERLASEELFSLWRDRMQLSEDEVFISRENASTEQRKGSPPTGDMGSGKGIQPPHLARSHSYFEDNYEILDTPTEEMWIQDRRAHSTGLPSYEGFPGSDVVALFRQYTQLYNPPSSIDLTNDTLSKTNVSDLFQEIERHSTTQGCDKILDDNIWHYLLPHMESISLLSASSRRKMEYKTKHHLVHCETRAEWESLLSILFNASDQNFQLRTDCDREVNLPRNVASELVPFIDSDKRTCFDMFMGYATIIQAQKLEWERYQDSLANGIPKLSHENLILLLHRSLMIGGRVLLFTSEFNKRHLWRSVQCDPPINQAACLGIITMETPYSDLRADTSCFNERFGSPTRYPDAGLSHFTLPSNLLKITGDAMKPDVSLELALIYYGYSGKTFSRPHQIAQTSMNLVRMNLVAGVTHLSSLGIVEFPLFGVAIEGSVGTVICAWCGPLEVRRQTQSSIYILDKDTVQYDLATPIGAYNYATFLCFLANKHAPQLAARLSKRWTSDSELSTKQWEENDWIRKDWTMAEQASWFKEQGYLDDDEC